MLIRKAALFSAFAFYGAPALADMSHSDLHRDGHQPTPKTITAFDVNGQSVEIMAVTRRARADTEFLRDYVDDSASMSKVMPGYPQPAVVSVDLRFQF